MNMRCPGRIRRFTLSSRSKEELMAGVRRSIFLLVMFACATASPAWSQPAHWLSIGPAHVFGPPTAGLGTYNAVGRITTIAVHPTNSSIIYAGSAGQLGHEGCGVWKTINGGATWTPIADGLPTLAVG